jgi:hypothetical protein
MEDEMGRTLAHKGRPEIHTGFWWERQKEKDN